MADRGRTTLKVRAVTLDAGDTLVRDRWDPFGLWLECAEALGRTPPPEARALAEGVLAGREHGRRAANESADEAEYLAFWRGAAGEWARQCGWDPGFGASVVDAAAARVLDPGGGVLAPFDDAVPCLEALRRQGLRLAVVSNWDFSLFLVLRSFGLERYFDAVLASEVVGHAKPDGRIFAAALSRLGVAPGESCHVGDDLLADYEGARGHGMAAYLLDRAGAPGEGRIGSLAELPGLLA